MGEGDTLWPCSPGSNFLLIVSLGDSNQEPHGETICGGDGDRRYHWTEQTVENEAAGGLGKEMANDCRLVCICFSGWGVG